MHSFYIVYRDRCIVHTFVLTFNKLEKKREEKEKKRENKDFSSIENYFFFGEKKSV